MRPSSLARARARRRIERQRKNERIRTRIEPGIVSLRVTQIAADHARLFNGCPEYSRCSATPPRWLKLNISPPTRFRARRALMKRLFHPPPPLLNRPHPSIYYRIRPCRGIIGGRRIIASTTIDRSIRARALFVISSDEIATLRRTAECTNKFTRRLTSTHCCFRKYCKTIHISRIPFWLVRFVRRGRD